MGPAELHAYVRQSLRAVIAERVNDGLRFVLESGTAEGFLRDLLAITLHSDGHLLSRELPTPRGIVDLVLHADEDVYIEAKQLHLKDGARHAANLVRDLERHGEQHVLGVVYLLDERRSSSEVKYARFGGANRRATCGVHEFLASLQSTFGSVYPAMEGEALVHRFKGAGEVDVYAFVVSLHPASQVEALRT